MSLPILYSFRRCPYAMRARMAIGASGMRVQLREVVLRCKPVALLEASPKGTVPVLVLPDGRVIEQSLDIMQWALQQHDPMGWLPTSGSAESEAKALVHRCDVEFKPHLDRYKYPNRYHLADGQANRAEGAAFLRALDHRLQAQPLLQGPAWGWADAAIAPFVRQFAHTDPTWFAAQDWQALVHWLTSFEGSDFFKVCMAVFPPWQPGDPAVFYPAA